MKSLFDQIDYKAYLRSTLDVRARGGRSALAHELRCQLAYVSQVLKGDAHFSLEQAEAMKDFLGHSEEEQEYFLLLVSYARAGSAGLEKRFLARIREIQNARVSLDYRLKGKATLNEERRAVYYSAWYYGAIHLPLSIPGFRTREAIAERLRLPRAAVGEALEFLTEAGLAERHGSEFRVGQVQLHLRADARWVSTQHANWRGRAVQSLDRGPGEDFHYTSIVSMAKADVPKVRKIFADTIEAVRAVVRDSPEDDVFCYSLDLFKA